MLFKEISVLVGKEIALEWRQKYALNGIIMYLASTIFICYLSFGLQLNQISPPTWNALFWIIILFTSVNAVAKSFIQEKSGSWIYLYTLASPAGLITSKIIYNSGLMTFMALMGFAFYSLVMGNPVQDPAIFTLTILLASIGLSSTLTMISAIASKARNSGTLMVILSFPILIPMLLTILKISKNAIDGLDRSINQESLLVLLAINLIVVTTALFLFPYLWRN